MNTEAKFITVLLILIATAMAAGLASLKDTTSTGENHCDEQQCPR